eukprot:CAMPEP_0170178828 /NCGR_PEP_ID=MMETSP0040_2-20121228/14691_1 /TAXON_ID=641309 /ORGANISM="Lotharella oceanica, Strain CCMP622" /LENGTH=83 /DNA_ID=CAMNT_0010422409 /DNA_START=199 /DNA_END=452 /DNA_ORIENTATION=-
MSECCGAVGRMVKCKCSGGFDYARVASARAVALLCCATADVLCAAGLSCCTSTIRSSTSSPSDDAFAQADSQRQTSSFHRKKL